MATTDLEKFAKNYINAWSTTNSEERKQLIEKVYSASAEFYAEEPGDKAVEHHGLENIYGNITQVNERLVVANGLITELVSFAQNHDTLRVAWQMKTPNGNIALTGMNFLHLNNSGKIERDYIFIG